jgi:hypothetical protein
LTLAYERSLAILINSHSAILSKNRTERAERTEAERAAPSVRKKRDLLLQKSVHPFHRFDLTFVVLLCLENFREYFSSVFDSLLLYL